MKAQIKTVLSQEHSGRLRLAVAAFKAGMPHHLCIRQNFEERPKSMSVRRLQRMDGITLAPAGSPK